MSERIPEKKAEIQKLAREDAFDGMPMNRFLRTDPDYVEGWNSAQKEIELLEGATNHE